MKLKKNTAKYFKSFFESECNMPYVVKLDGFSESQLDNLDNSIRGKILKKLRQMKEKEVVFIGDHKEYEKWRQTL